MWKVTNRRGTRLLLACSALMAAAPVAVLPSPIAANRGATSLDQLSKEIRDVAKRVEPSVVHIEVKGTAPVASFLQTPDDEIQPGSPEDFFRRFFETPFGDRRESAPESPYKEYDVPRTVGAGSGWIYDAKGHVVTNNHVVRNAQSLTVKLFDGREYPADVVASDPATDVAVLQIKADHLTPGVLAEQPVEQGDIVFAFGSPFEFEFSMSQGVVSGSGRHTGILGPSGYEDFIQTDASINPGNSGGALVNMRGELVGINSAIVSRTGGNVGIGFAVPSEIAQSIMRQILDFGEVRRGLLGVSIQTIDTESAKALGAEVESGALVSAIEAGSAAEDAGLKVDDIITRVNDKKIDNSRELANAIGLKGSGEQVDIEFVRDGKTHTVRATLGQRVTSQVAGIDVHPGLEGAVFASASTLSSGGIEVVDVEPGSPAAQRGLRAGDIIVEVNRQEVQNVQQVRDIADVSRILFLQVQRGDRSLMLQIR